MWPAYVWNGQETALVWMRLFYNQSLMGVTSSAFSASQPDGVLLEDDTARTEPFSQSVGRLGW